jgi:nitrogen regulatory protein PII
MTHHQATKVVIITERIILKAVTEIIRAAGATGYTITPAGGMGSRGVRSSDRAGVVEELSNFKIEVIVGDQATADRIADEVAERFFENYSGITYLERVEILRPYKF